METRCSEALKWWASGQYNQGILLFGCRWKGQSVAIYVPNAAGQGWGGWLLSAHWIYLLDRCKRSRLRGMYVYVAILYRDT